ncbi:venom acid phosphatase Acph-1-like [Cylas formicarius]|uniref:venom acid phosphatase Acph-1-like n=1 Tax=Cylas formicarius TaxID=197179 RepID=UPI0029584BC6|nr:venom acid phosphatase Acph-1-like [Cylas formicarius]
MGVIILATTILSILCDSLAEARSVEYDGTLVMVHTLFRHGDRTPDDGGYESNPYNDEQFYEPLGWGQLTNEGRRREYRIGTTLRQRYNDFLGDVYDVDLLDARSTNYNRTKMSVELMLAGLFPPKDDQIWLPWLLWQPIPYNYLTFDKELFSWTCSNYNAIYNELLASDEIQELFTPYQSIFSYISNYTGLNVTKPDDIFGLYWSLRTQQEYGYPLEDWTKEVYPEVFEKIAKDVYYLRSNTTALKKISGGFLLRKILEDSRRKIDGTLTPPSRKLFIYSAHEMNVATFLGTLGIYPGDIPEYGSHVLVELHKINGQFGFKFYYQNWQQSDPQLMIIPGCESFCKMELFEELIAELIPSDEDCETA